MGWPQFSPAGSKDSDLKPWRKCELLGRMKRVIVVEIVLLMTIASLFLPGGEDLHRFYLPFAEGDLAAGFAPYHASWALWPLGLVPDKIVWPMWTLATLLIIVWACWRLGTNVLPVLFAFPLMAQVWLGQIEAVVIAGLVLALLSRSPWLRGLGLAMASVKPHVSGAAILLLLWYDQEKWKVLAVPTVVLALSMMEWGIDWPVRWFLSRNEPPMHVWRLAAGWPWGIVAFTVLPLLRGKREKVVGVLLASALGMPYFGTYSYVAFMVFLSPWWAAPLSYCWVAAYPWLGNSALKLAWLLPLSLLAYLVWGGGHRSTGPPQPGQTWFSFLQVRHDKNPGVRVQDKAPVTECLAARDGIQACRVGSWFSKMTWRQFSSAIRARCVDKGQLPGFPRTRRGKMDA